MKSPPVGGRDEDSSTGDGKIKTIRGDCFGIALRVNINRGLLRGQRLAIVKADEEDQGLFTTNEAFAEYHGGVQQCDQLFVGAESGGI